MISQLVVPVVFAALGATSTPSDRLGRSVERFSLEDYRGRVVALSDFSDRPIIVIAFLGTECPLARLYGPRLEQLGQEYRDKGIAIIGINANQQDSMAEIADYAQRHGITFPILKDVDNKVADQLGAVRTPEVFVLDAQRRIRYWGRIDDQYGVGIVRPRPEREDLRTALDQLLAGQPVGQPEVESVGCYIGRVRQTSTDTSVTYAHQISRILQRHCVECHRAGEIGPFSMTDYDEVVGWAETIAEVIRDGRMPPWHANPAYGSFVNARVMADEEKELVYRWVAEGAPLGDPAQLPATPHFVEGWRLPRLPDHVIAMRQEPFRVPAQGSVEYQYFVVDPGFQEDKWVKAAQVAPGNRAVVHHAIVFVRSPSQRERDDMAWLAAYVPGQTLTTLPRGYAFRVPAGSKLVFQLHYTPNGSEQEDVTRVGLIYADPAEVKYEVLTLVAMNRDFEIPPGADNHRVSAWLGGLPTEGTILTLAPHMHLRGKSFRFVAHQGDSRTILLDVPRYDFNWQHAYQLAEPLRIGPNMRIECIAHFDNSPNNPVNPDPGATVRWGDQTWEEMVVGYMSVAVPWAQSGDGKRPEQLKREIRNPKSERNPKHE